VSTANTPTPLRPITNISSRAAELKAQLLKGRERVNSATPPVGMVGKPGKQQPSASDGSSSFRGSPQTPATATETVEQELNINELISQYADPKPAADNQMKDFNNNLPTLSQRPSLPDPPAKSQVPSLGSPTKVTKSHNDKMIGNGFNTKNLESRNASSGSMSEGEIFEDPAAKKALPATEPREAKAVVKAINKEEPAPRNPRDEQPFKTSSVPRESSPRRPLPSNPKPQTPRYVENRRDEADPRQDRRPCPSNYTNEQRPHLSDSDRSRSPQQRRDMRDQNEDHHKLETKSEWHEDTSRSHREAKPPILDELLPYDVDLREWLEITGYHNKPYRGKILNRRRAIAQLDAQRNALLAEMEAEERGGIPAVNGIPITSTIILQPPMPNRVGDRAEAFPMPRNATPEIQRDRVVSNKRSHSEVQDIREESSAKFARTNDHAPRVKQEDDDYGRPRSSGYDLSRRRSFDDRFDDRDASRAHHEGSRGRGRSDSRERDVSPPRKTYEGRPPLRSRGNEGGDDREDRSRDRSERLERSFVVRGGYRGRAFDPNYRGRGGRGGGRGRGDYQSHVEPKSESGAFGPRFANSKPYKDTRGFERGGRGGQ
jgi:hypothetical protein